MPDQAQVDEFWRRLVSGSELPEVVRRLRTLHRFIPSAPRCKFCNSPFRGLGAPLMRLMGREPWPKNPNYCSYCFKTLSQMPGGAEGEISLLFADVRGSSALAERMSPSELTKLMNRFFHAATHVVIESDGVVEKLIGDEVAALYIPGFTGPDHAGPAINAAERLLRATGHDRPEGPWIPVGVGVHTGAAYVGYVGSTEGVTEFTALGDAVNATAHLAKLAAAGEILVTETAARASGRAFGTVERRELALKGHEHPLSAYVLRMGSAGAVTVGSKRTNS